MVVGGPEVVHADCWPADARWCYCCRQDGIALRHGNRRYLEASAVDPQWALWRLQRHLRQIDLPLLCPRPHRRAPLPICGAAGRSAMSHGSACWRL